MSATPALPSVKVIINADDLGISARVNDAIFGLMADRKVSSASLMANGAAFQDAVRQMHHFPACSFGVHLNITEFEPLRFGKALRPLTTANGHFNRQARRVPLTRELKAAIFREWSLQVERVLQAGVAVSHVDSHHHTHTLIPLLPFVKRLCARFGIKRIRMRHTFEWPLRPRLWRVGNRLYNWRLRKTEGLLCAQEFGPFAAFLSAVPRFSRNSTTVECMVHPGHPAYNAETESLVRSITPEFRERYHLITYSELN
jgi:chitin disaccharide deacetylase